MMIDDAAHEDDDVDDAGVLVRVPCDPLPFLEAGYGPAWDEPHQKWSYGGGSKVIINLIMVQLDG